MIRLSTWLVGAALGALISSCAFAVDGVVLIDQNRALAGNVTPGDAPGFPVSITQPGSYKLSGNLTLPNGNTSGILLSASNVTVDLGGFSILGPVDCSNVESCNFLPPRTVRAIGNLDLAVQLFNITIRNGTIQGIGGAAIDLRGHGHLIEQLHIRNVLSDGIALREVTSDLATVGTSIVRNNTVELGMIAINVAHAIVAENVLRNNRSWGIGVVGSGRVVNNVITGNGQALALGSSVSWSGNILSNNSAGVGGGVNLGQNLCDNAVCSGASY
jgi:hypothetical protein